MLQITKAKTLYTNLTYMDKIYSTDRFEKIDADLQDSDLAIKSYKESTVEETAKKMEYGKSRWDYELKRGLERGAYHYDHKKEDDINNVLYFHGNVKMDYDYFIKNYGPGALDNSVHWANRNQSVGGNYGIDQEVYDIVRAGGDPEGKIYGRSNMFSDPKAQKLAEDLFGIYDYELKLHTQVTGQLLHLHMDNFAARLDRKNSFQEMDYDKDATKIRRFVVFLSDWQQGQVWVQGTATWTHWKAGDIISWDWQDIPHGTVNLGWDKRYILQFTGRTTQKTLDFLANTTKDSTHDLDIHNIDDRKGCAKSEDFIKYFGKSWQPKHDLYTYSSWRILGQIKPNDQVLDIGCGYNIFKNALGDRLYGIDPCVQKGATYEYTEETNFNGKLVESHGSGRGPDEVIAWEHYTPHKEFNVFLCLGSLNFGDTDYVEAQIKKLADTCKPGNRVYWRQNPGRSDHPHKGKEVVKFFPHSFEQNQIWCDRYGFELKECKWDDNNRIYAVWIKT